MDTRSTGRTATRIPWTPTSAIKRVQSSFQVAQHHPARTRSRPGCLPYEPSASQTLTAKQYGPAVSATYPLGRYVQDYDYVAGSGDLDQYNGRFSVTPDFPAGTYAYFVTLNNDGSPAFPYIINVQIYGTSGGGTAQTVASDAVDYFHNGALAQAASTDPRLASWYTQGSQQDALAISGFNPSAGSSTTWPTNVPSGVTVSGGNSSPALAGVQRVRYDSGTVYVNSNNLPRYTIGPWFEATMTGGVFMNWPSASSQQMQLSRNPSPAATKPASGMGPVGIWVNGVAIFNVLDGGSYMQLRRHGRRRRRGVGASHACLVRIQRTRAARHRIAGAPRILNSPPYSRPQRRPRAEPFGPPRWAARASW